MGINAHQRRNLRRSLIIVECHNRLGFGGLRESYALDAFLEGTAYFLANPSIVAAIAPVADVVPAGGASLGGGAGCAITGSTDVQWQQV